MARVLTNYLSLIFGLQANITADPTRWKQLEPNTVGRFGADVSRVARNPISKDRQRKKGIITDLDSAADFEVDLTMDAAQDFVSGFVFAAAAQAETIVNIRAGALWDNLAADDALPTVAGTPPGYTHDALSAAIAAGTLVYARGFTNAVNNGLFEVDSGGLVGETPIVSGTQIDETPGNTSGAQLDVAGFRGATGDITWTDASKTIGSTTLDFTTLGLSVGQFIHVGGLTSTNQFANGTAFGRIVSIAANAIVIDKATGSLIDAASDDNGSGKRIDLLYGRFYRNVDVDASDFAELYFQFEAGLPNLQNPDGTGPEYIYSVGNLCNQLGFQIPLTNKATFSAGFIGRDTEDPTTTRKTDAVNAAVPVMDTAFSTASDIARLRVTEVDETGLTTFFKSMTMTLLNNVSPEKVLATLGGAFMNAGNFFVNFENTQILFTDSDVVKAIRANRTVTMDWIIKNEDGGVAVDIPSMTLGGGGLDLPVNNSVLLNITAEAHDDATLGTSIGISTFPALP